MDAESLKILVNKVILHKPYSKVYFSPVIYLPSVTVKAVTEIKWVAVFGYAYDLNIVDENTFFKANDNSTLS